MDDADLIVLGLGPGGEAVAQRAAGEDWRVVGVDERLLGGECPYFGCIPSKMLLRASQTLTEADRANTLAGSTTVDPNFDPVAERIRDEATADWDDTAAVERFENAGGTFVRGRGRITGRDDAGHLIVEAAGRSFRAPKVVVATGTDPVLPAVDGLADARASADGTASAVWTNREAVRATEAPSSLIVLGGGPLGCEFAQGFARFGSMVTQIEGGDRLLGREEPEVSEVLVDVFGENDIDVRLGAPVEAVELAGGRVRVTLDAPGAATQTVTADKLLVAAGRRPKVSEIGLERIGVDSEADTLQVDENMQVTDAEGATVDGLFALGDVTGRGPFTHVATWQARVLGGHLLGEPEPFGGYHGLAWTTFTDPEVGRVGMSEAEARDAGLSVRTGRAEIASDTRGWIHGPGNAGFVKLVADADADVLVGATVVGPHGGEVLGLCTLAVHARVPLPTLASMHFVFPTLHRTVLEALNDLA